MKFLLRYAVVGNTVAVLKIFPPGSAAVLFTLAPAKIFF
jgi:hypothetical protein